MSPEASHATTANATSKVNASGTATDYGHARTHVGDRPSKLVWVFAIMAVGGLAMESVQHIIAFGEWENRMGLIWGPFSPIYGLAALLLTSMLEPLQERSAALLFLIGAVLGGGLEYFTSWAMETFWGVVAWSYLEIPLNFDGRTDIFHCIVWGALSVLWIKVGLPLFERGFNRVNVEGAAYRIVSTLLSVFLIVDAFVTVTAMLRADARTHGEPAITPLGQLYDQAYPNEVLQERFGNMGGIGRAD